MRTRSLILILALLAPPEPILADTPSIWVIDSIAAFAEALRQIAANQRDFLQFSALDALQSLPPEIATHTDLRHISIQGTQITDIGPLSDLTDCKSWTCLISPCAT